MADEASMMDDLSAAWDAAESKGGADERQTETQTQTSGEKVPAEKIPGEKGEGQKAAQTAEKAPEKTAEPKGPGDGQPKPPPVPPEGAEKQGGDEVKASAESALNVAPRSLPPAAREAWKDTPQPVRDAIAKREADYEAGIAKYRDGAKRAESMDGALAPFAQYFAVNGNRPAETISGVLQTASLLQMGSPIQKAMTVATLIKQFGIDIGTLDTVLVGEKPQTNEFEQLLNQRLAPLQQQLQTYQQRDQQHAQQIQSRISSDITAFANDAKNEFYEDVRLEMADILDLAATQGRDLTLQDAYNKACLLHPEISAIIRNRESSQQLPDKRRAASSIHGTQGGEGGKTAPESLRGALEAAWESHQRA